MEIIGRPTINPFLFYTGKFAGYTVWTLYLLSLFKIIDFPSANYKTLTYISLFIASLAMIIITVSFINLGKSSTLGLPRGKTEFKSKGLYRFSRNPAYAGFNLLTMASIIHTLNLSICIAGAYSIVIYHLIIKGEEKFLEKRFKTRYLKYKKQVRRYL